MWGCFVGGSTGKLAKMDQIIIKYVNLTILENDTIPTGDVIVGEELIYQQDKDHKHTAKVNTNKCL